MAQAPVTSIFMHGRPVDILRLELAQPALQGNKYYKLKYNLEHMRAAGYHALMTFGGVFSNHIHATAIACKNAGIQGIAVLRGEDDPGNPTLQFIRAQGMETLFINREKYRLRNMTSFVEELSSTYGNVYVLPEGGTNALAVKGCSEILEGRVQDYDHIFCAVGTGGTISGIISTPGLKAEVTGIAVLKGEKDTLTPYVNSLIGDVHIPWRINFDHHFGGYAKFNPALMDYIEKFTSTHQIKPDPVYTAKVFYAVDDMISKNKIPEGQRILCIHTGGLQGWDGWHYRFKKQDTSAAS